jgi:hypothetical protein
MLRIERDIDARVAARLKPGRASTRALHARLATRASYAAPTAVGGVGLRIDARAVARRQRTAIEHALAAHTDVALRADHVAGAAMVAVVAERSALRA